MVDKINVALIGVGDVCSALVQGVSNYKKNPDKIIGILPEITQYSINDINFVLGIDVNANKVGKDLSEAIFASPNCNMILFDPEFLNAPVIKGPIMDGLDSNIKNIIPVENDNKPANTASDDRQGISAEDKSILIIEDDHRFAKVLVDLSREKGFKVHI